MNVMIYNLDNQFPEFLDILQKIPNISIFFAYTRKDAEKTIRDVKPQMLFTKPISNLDTIFIQEISAQHPNLKIYNLDENKNNTKLIFRECPTERNMSLEKLIKNK